MRGKLLVAALLVGALAAGIGISSAWAARRQADPLALDRQLRETQMAIVFDYANRGLLTPQELLAWQRRIAEAPQPALLELPSPEGLDAPAAAPAGSSTTEESAGSPAVEPRSTAPKPVPAPQPATRAPSAPPGWGGGMMGGGRGMMGGMMGGFGGSGRGMMGY